MSFLNPGGAQGTDTLMTQMESFKFVLASTPGSLMGWWQTGSGQRDHPGARRRDFGSAAALLATPPPATPPATPAPAAAVPASELPGGVFKSFFDGVAGVAGVPRECTDAMLMRVSRGMQRAIGSAMIVTPMGAKRHYTMSYVDFCARLDTNPQFSALFESISKGEPAPSACRC